MSEIKTISPELISHTAHGTTPLEAVLTAKKVLEAKS